MADILPSPTVGGIKGYLFFALKVALSLMVLSFVFGFLGTSVLEVIERPKVAWQNVRAKFGS